MSLTRVPRPSLRQLIRFAAYLLVVLAPLPVRAATYYVAVTGSDNAAGTDAAPFATVGRAQTAAVAGDTVFIHGGVYSFSGTTGTVGVSFTKDGAAGRPINYFAVPGETPIFDLFNLLPQARVTGLNVACDWIHIRGLEVRGTQQIIVGDSWGVRIQGSNNIIEGVNSHDNEAPGFFITSGSNNLILNCDSHNNYDPLEAGGNGDGFGCHSAGGGNVLSGCRSYDNSDDGYDFINAAGSCTVEKSFSFRNGWRPGTTTAAGNGAGFKAGGYGSPPVVPGTGAAMHTVRQCVAFGNRSQGFYANHHPGRINFLNNTGFNNPANYNMLADAGFPSDHVLRNNIAMATGSTISNLTGGTATFNSWNLTVTVSAADFASVAQTEVTMPRAADFSLPAMGFMHLVAGSDLIDKGTDVMLPFVGAAPDLGAFEFGAATGAGGATGSGGATGAGGAAGGGGVTGSGGSRVTGAGGGGATGLGGAGGVTGGGGSSVTGGGGSSVTGGGGSSVTGGGGARGGGGTTGGAGGLTGGGDIDGASGGCACHIAVARDGAGVTATLLTSLLGIVVLQVRRRRARSSRSSRSSR